MAKDKAGKWYTTPKTLNEQLALDEAMTGPNIITDKRKRIKDDIKGDPRIPAYSCIDKWSYSVQIFDSKTGKRIENIQIHYLADRNIGIKFDFKFKID
ncbi:hypothetical protein [Saprospira grandis]|uniref:hypothetical protein n=1 Tax=Saprospira grandis TaxID=1008 RepID=UPI0022DDC97F|nr:hypothetical protein [Saprospira grandis]WBM76122.1 hypothetical protein OP864_07790 [Saprospira grandis]